MKFLPNRICTMLATAWLACVGLAPHLQAQEEGDAFAVSNRRVELLQRLTREYLADAGVAANDAQATREILRRFAQGEPDCPTGTISTAVRTDADVEQVAERIVAGLLEKKFPPLVVANLVTEAQARYPIYQKGDLVEFYYATNPQNVRKVRGVYGGRNARLVQIGAAAIQLEDIVRVKGNDDLVLRFDPAASEELRKTYVADRLAAYEEEKETYQAQATTYTRAKERERTWHENQAAGYLFVNQDWTTARDLVGSLIAEEKANIRRAIQAAAERELAEKRGRLAVAARQQAVLEPVIAAAVAADVEAEYAAYAKRQADAAAEPVPVAPETTPEATENDDDWAAGMAAAPAAPAPVAAEPPPAPAKLMPTWAYAVIAGVVLAGAVVGFLIYRQQAGGPSRELKKFFQGKGKVQRTFWQMADDNPQTFKYVAYRYTTAEEARQALLQLSYVNERVGGDLVCRHDVYFGYGPHQDKFVSFVGGEKLNYALWREASAVFPEYPGAEYFRVSTAPSVNLEIPNLDSLLADPELQIEHVENREGEGTDYSQYYVYRAPAKENALEFLKHASVQEAGLHVIVLTKEGVFGKDENGIYEEAMDLWAERYPEIFDEEI